MNQNKSVKIRFKGFTEAWEQRKLKDFTLSYSGGTPTVSNKNYYNGTIPFIRSGEISGERTELFISEEGLNKSSAKRVHKGQILYALYGATSGEVSLSKIDGAINQAILAISTKEGYSNAFLSFWLRKEKDRITATFLQGGQGNLSGEIVKNLIVPVPSQLEQTKIGNFFNQLDGIITLHQRKLNRFQKIRTTFLQKMFPKNGETKPAIRLTGFNADWEQEKLQNFAVRITRKNIKKQNNRPLTISAQHGLVDQTVYFNNRVAAQDVSNYYLIKKGEFAYNRSTSKDAPVGAVRRLVDYEEGVLSTLYLVFSITDPQHVDPNYLSYFFETTGWHSWILERAAEGARNHGLLNVSSQDFLSLPVMLPSSLEEQQKIGEFFQKIDDCIILLERQADLLKQIKSSLLLNMFPPSNAE